jgi:hypothetical protein
VLCGEGAQGFVSLLSGEIFADNMRHFPAEKNENYVAHALAHAQDILEYVQD